MGRRRGWPSAPPRPRDQTEWRDDAACANTKTQVANLFVSDYVSRSELALMEAICAGCPVLAHCAATAEHYRPQAGFWAGRGYNMRLVSERLAKQLGTARARECVVGEGARSATA